MRTPSLILGACQETGSVWAWDMQRDGMTGLREGPRGRALSATQCMAGWGSAISSMWSCP